MPSKYRYFLSGLALLALLAVLPTSANAQTLTTVTGTVTDPNGLPYAGARLSIALVSPGGPSPSLTPCNSPSSGCQIQNPGAVTLDGAGSIPGGGINLWANASILPPATTYSFQVTLSPGALPPFGTGPQSFTVTGVTIAGATQSLSATLSAAALALTRPFVGTPAGPSGSIQCNAGGVFAACPDITDPGAGFLELALGSIFGQLYNAGGTIPNGTLVKFNSSNQVIQSLTTDTSGIIGLSTSIAFVGQQVAVLRSGIGTLELDGACTVGQPVINSSTIAGNGHCTSTPGTAQVVGIVRATLGGAGSASVDFSFNETLPNAGGSGTVTTSGTPAQYQAAVFSSGTAITGVAPTANSQCFMSAASNYATTNPLFATCPAAMVYPGAGVANSTGSAWGTSYTVGTAANNLVQLNASAQLPAVSAALLTSFPTLNQNTTGTAATITGALALANTPLTTTQDILFDNAGSLGRLALVPNGTCLGSTAGVWASITCSGSGTVVTGTQYAFGEFQSAGTTIATGPTPPSVNGSYICGYTVTGSAAVAPTCPLVGVLPRAVTGATSTDTILYSDNAEMVDYQGSVAVAVSLPTPTTLGNAQFVTTLQNNTSGSSTALTVTATTLIFQSTGTTSLTVAQGQACTLFVDPNGTQWDNRCIDLPFVAGSGLAVARGQYGPTMSLATALPNGTTATTQAAASADTKLATDAYVDGHFIANGIFTLNTAAVASGACETVVTVAATGVATTDVVSVGFNGDPTAVTGYGASATGAVLSIYPYPTSGNVNVKVCNSTSASITPSAMTLNWKVTR